VTAERFVLFDIDGTLMDAGGSGRWALTRAFEDVFDIDDAEPHSRKVHFAGMTDPDILRAIAANAGVPCERLDQCAAGLEERYLHHLALRLEEIPDKRPMPGVVELLDRLAGVGSAAVGLATGNIERGARLKLASVSLDGYFETGGFGRDAPDRAGVGRVARERLERLRNVRVGDGDVLLVGDAVEDVRAARANGFRSLAVGTGWVEHERLLAEEPDLFLTDLTDFGRVMQFIFGTRG